MQVVADADLPSPLRPVIEHADTDAQQQIYVSDAWGGHGSAEDLAREAAIEALCEQAEARDIHILRDKDVMKYGDNIYRFMDTLSAGRRVYIIFSEKYLHCPMHVRAAPDLSQPAG